MSVEVVPVTDEWARQAHIDNDAYLKMYAQSVEDPESFWGEHGKRLDLDEALYACQEHLLRSA
jgi:acetyl-CoA synthetase